MKIILGLVALAVLGAPVQATEVGLSLTIGQPGFYGTIDIGNYPRPRLIYAEPVIIQHVRVRSAPVYMHVPPGHAKHWHKHCGFYDACSRPVYFVEGSWYRDTYVPLYRERHGHPGKGKGRGHGGPHR